MSDNVTFREVEIKQSEAEAIADKPLTSSLPDPISKAESDKIITPLSIYYPVKGVPYTVDHLGIKNYWDLSQKEGVDRTLGSVKTKVGVIEGYMKRQIQKNFMPDTVDSYKNLMKMIDKVVNYTNVGDSLERLSKVYNFVTSSNKSKSLNSLRRALLVRSVDQLVDLDNVKTSTLGQFMLRKD